MLGERQTYFCKTAEGECRKHPKKGLMKPTRQAASRRPIPLKKLVPNVKIVTDPKKLALLKAEAARLKRLDRQSGI
jgi:hypothetical protein